MNKIKNEPDKVEVSNQCRKWWRRHRFSLIGKWMSTGFNHNERKFLAEGLSDLNPYYHPDGVAYSHYVNLEYQNVWLQRCKEHPDSAHWVS